MIFYTMKSKNGSLAYVRSCGNRYVADVTNCWGLSDNANWTEEFLTVSQCRKHLEKSGFEVVCDWGK